jgi:enamine deaminase RidA (YjgF/YER057c/UK114 family)
MRQAKAEGEIEMKPGPQTIATMTALAVSMTMLTGGPVAGQETVYHKMPTAEAAVSRAVEVPAGATMVYLTSVGPPATEGRRDATSPAAAGSTQQQTVRALEALSNLLQELGLTLADVVKIQVFLAGDPARGGRADYAAFVGGYAQFFDGAKNDKLPVRSVVTVAALPNPDWLVQLDVIAVRPAR